MDTTINSRDGWRTKVYEFLSQAGIDREELGKQLTKRFDSTLTGYYGHFFVEELRHHSGKQKEVATSLGLGAYAISRLKNARENNCIVQSDVFCRALVRVEKECLPDPTAVILAAWCDCLLLTKTQVQVALTVPMGAGTDEYVEREDIEPPTPQDVLCLHYLLDPPQSWQEARSIREKHTRDQALGDAAIDIIDLVRDDCEFYGIDQQQRLRGLADVNAISDKWLVPAAITLVLVEGEWMRSS